MDYLTKGKIYLYENFLKRLLFERKLTLNKYIKLFKKFCSYKSQNKS